MQKPALEDACNLSGSCQAEAQTEQIVCVHREVHKKANVSEPRQALPDSHKLMNENAFKACCGPTERLGLGH